MVAIKSKSKAKNKAKTKPCSVAKCKKKTVKAKADAKIKTPVKAKESPQNQSSQNQGPQNHLEIPAIFDLPAAMALKPKLEALLNCQDAIVDLSKVSRVSTAGIQLLAAFANKCRELDKPIYFVNLSSEFEHTLILLGINQKEFFYKS